MKQERKPSILAIESFRKNFDEFVYSITLTFEALNGIIAEQGVSENIKNIARGLYLVKLNYFNLQKQHLETIKKDLIKDEFYEVVNSLSIIETQIELSIESTLKELKDIDDK